MLDFIIQQLSNTSENEAFILSLTPSLNG